MYFGEATAFTGLPAEKVSSKQAHFRLIQRRRLTTSNRLRRTAGSRGVKKYGGSTPRLAGRFIVKTLEALADTLIHGGFAQRGRGKNRPANGLEKAIMADVEVVANQKTLLEHQKQILTNQEQILSNQKEILSNQTSIKSNQDALDEILENQKQILASVKK